MFSRFRIAFGIVLFLSLLIVMPVFAGGWAIITLDELPVHAAAGEPLTIGFTVLQHGRTPLTGQNATITAALFKKEQFVVEAKEEGKPGHYSATLTFPKEGDWSWSIQVFTMDQPMPSISISAPVVVGSNPPAKQTASLPPLLIVRVLAFGIGLIGLLVVLRSKNRLAIAVTATCLLVGIGSFVTRPAVPKVEAQGNSSPASSIEGLAISQVEMGRRLFVAKGCLGCHYNSKANEPDYLTVEMGAPNLSNFSASPEALRLRLKDPTLVKSDTQMPNLNLSEAEIEALIAFINSK